MIEPGAGSKDCLTGVQLVSWDLDGTCYSLPKLRRQLIVLLLRRALTEPPRQLWREWWEFRALLDSLRQAVAASRKIASVVNPRREFLERRWLETALRTMGPRAHLRQVLQDLRARGLPQVVFTNFQARGKLSALGLDDVFDACYCGEEVGYKPNPTGFERMARDFGVPVPSILHIGDRPDQDGAAANAAGCRCLILGQDLDDLESLREATALPVIGE